MQLVKGSKIIKINKISDLVFPYTKNGNTGHIHSIFKNSINISVKDRLIHISSNDKYLSCFGMTIGEEDFRDLLNGLKINDLVIIKKESLSIYTRRGVYKFINDKDNSLSMKIIVRDLDLPYINKIIDQIKTFLTDKSIGIAYDEKYRCYKEILTKGDINEGNFNSLICYFIGRGLGLTPSGDDILLGYCFGLMTLGHNYIRSLIEKNLIFIRSNTTDISYQYLYSLSCQYISSSLLLLNKAFIMGKKNIYTELKNISAIGHTSGNDSLYGLLMALEYVKSTKER